MPVINTDTQHQSLLTFLFIRREIYCFAFFAIVINSSFAQSDAPNEDHVKSVFIYNFAQFSEWPSKRFERAASPFIIGVIGQNNLTKILQQVVAGEFVSTHPIQIEQFNSIDQARDCHILFIDRSRAHQLDKILQEIKGRGILTVSDIDNFTLRGGIIRLFTEENKIRFEINVDAAKAENVLLSSKLLRLAKICCDKDEP